MGFTSFIWCFLGMRYTSRPSSECSFLLNFDCCRFLVYVQGKCNKQLSFLMGLAFYSQLVIVVIVILDIPGTDHTGLDHWLIAWYPLSRLPMFFMGICAGLLCVRIQEGDLDAINSKMSNC